MRGYKSLQDVTLTMRPLRLLIGANAAGKSNVVDALRFLSEAVQSDVATALARRGGLPTVVFLGASEKRFELGLDYGTPGADARELVDDLRYTLVVGEQEGVPGVVMETLKTMANGQTSANGTWLQSAWGKGTAPNHGGEQRPNTFELDSPVTLALRAVGVFDEYPKIRTLKKLITAWRFLSVDLHRMREPRRDERTSTLASDAINLANVLRTLQGSADYEEILEILQRLLGHVTEVATDLDRGVVRLLMREEPFADPVEALALSDGTLRLLAIATALVTMPEHGLLCIEEAEQGLHPLLLGVLLDVIRERCPADGTRQVILTTHSPDLLDAAEPDDVVIVERDTSGGTVLRELDEPKLKQWLQEFRLGELWRMRQLGGVPT